MLRDLRFGRIAYLAGAVVWYTRETVWDVENDAQVPAGFRLKPAQLRAVAMRDAPINLGLAAFWPACVVPRLVFPWLVARQRAADQ